MVAQFAMSDSGKVYGRTCRQFGVDPGAVLDDDVMAANLRVALAVADVERTRRARHLRRLAGQGPGGVRVSFLGGLAGGAIGGAVVNLYLDDKQFKAGLAGAEAQTAKVGTTTTRFGGLATAAFAAAGVAAIQFGAASVRAFAESQQVMAQTEAVIESTGAAAGFSANEIGVMAAALQDETAFSDEAIQSAQNMLLTFTKIGHEAFPQATQAALDVATAFHVDLNSAAKLVGKALNDPVAGLTALTRAGVQFDAQQKEVIKRLVETGREAEAQEIILGELATQTGGSAAAAADTYEGKLAQLGNTFNDFQELIGSKLVPALETLFERLTAVAEVLVKLVPVVEQVYSGLEKVVPILQVFNEAMATDDLSGFQSGVEGINAALESGEIGFDRAVARVEALAEATGVELPDGAAAMVTAMQEAETGAEGLADGTKDVTTQMREARKAAKEAAKEYRDGVKEAFNIAGESVFGFKARFEGTVRSFATGLANMRRRAEETFRDLREFNKIDLGEGVKKFLLDQGPAAIDAFTDANKRGRQRIVDDIQAIITAHQGQGREIDQATNKTNDLNGAMDKLGRKKVTAEARIRYVLAEDSLDPGSLPGLGANG